MAISYIGFEKNLLVNITKTFLGPRQHIKFITALKMMKYGLSLTVFSCISTDADSVQIRENTVTILSIFRQKQILSKYGKIRVRFCLYTGKHKLEKARIWAYFTHWSSL